MIINVAGRYGVLMRTVMELINLFDAACGVLGAIVLFLVIANDYYIGEE